MPRANTILLLDVRGQFSRFCAAFVRLVIFAKLAMAVTTIEPQLSVIWVELNRFSCSPLPPRMNIDWRLCDIDDLEPDTRLRTMATMQIN